jgi:lipooligosaccharide transport system permease protein
VRLAAQLLPLYHGVELVRPLVAGQWPSQWPLHLGVLVLYAALACGAAILIARRRFSA